MFQYPYINLFLLTLFSRTFIAISSSHLLIIWISLELNIISFIPILASSSWFQESEASLKYFLFQALGSSLLLIGIVHNIFALLSLLGLIVKLGAAPFHFWFPSIIKRLPWPTARLLMTWQKIAPLVLIMSSFGSNVLFLSVIGVLGSIVGGFGGIAQSQFRPLLAYSSIGHIGWIIALIPFSPFIALAYLIFYIFISIPVLFTSFLSNIQSIKHQSQPNIFMIIFILLPCILSLRGLPPFLGFIPKLIAIISFSSYSLPIFLIIGSLINLRYYLNFFFSILLSNPSYKIYYKNKYRITFLLISWIACSPIPILLILIFII